jgi:hypothetical protein
MKQDIEMHLWEAKTRCGGGNERGYGMYAKVWCLSMFELNFFQRWLRELKELGVVTGYLTLSSTHLVGSFLLL